MVHIYNSTDTAPVWKDSSLILSERLDFHIVDNLLIEIHALFHYLLNSRIIIFTTENELLMIFFIELNYKLIEIQLEII